MYSKKRRTQLLARVEPVEPRRLFAVAAGVDDGPTPPDLSVATPLLIPPATRTSLSAGDDATVMLTLANTGQAAAATPFTGEVFLSRDEILSDDDPLLSTFEVANLAAGSSVPVAVNVTLPNADSAQTWYPIAVVDRAGAVTDDPDPANNASVGAPVTLAPKHLTLRSVSAPASVRAGETFTLTALADVTGLHPDAPNFLTATLHRQSLTFQLNPVPAPIVLPADTDGSATPVALLFTATLTLPASVPPGPYALEILPTLFKGTAEFAPGYVPPTLDVTTAAPYLSVGTPATTSAPLPSGDGLPVAFAASNSGGTTSTRSAVTFYLSKTSTLSKAATRLGSVAIDPLNAGASRDVVASLPTAGVAPGSYYLLGVIDSPNPASFDDTLTTSSVPVRVTIADARPAPPTPEPTPTPAPVPTPPVPDDLTLTSLSAASRYATAGSSLRVSITPTAPKPVLVRYYLSRDGTLSPSAVPLGNLPASTSTASLKVPANLAPGEYHLLAKIDPDNAVFESDETNNIRLAPGVITVFSPDLAGTLVPKPTAVRADTPATLALTLTNTAAKRVARKYNINYYLSSDDTFSPDDTKFSKQAVALALNKKQAHTINLSYKLPASAPLGTWYVIAVLDTPQRTPAAHMEVASKKPVKVAGPRVTADVRAVRRRGANTFVTLRLTNTGTAPNTNPVTLVLTAPGAKKPLFTTKRPLPLLPGRSATITLSLATKLKLDASTLSATIL